MSDVKTMRLNTTEVKAESNFGVITMSLSSDGAGGGQEETILRIKTGNVVVWDAEKQPTELIITFWGSLEADLFLSALKALTRTMK
jgi:hypothetical protein